MQTQYLRNYELQMLFMPFMGYKMNPEIGRTPTNDEEAQEILGMMVWEKDVVDSDGVTTEYKFGDTLDFTTSLLACMLVAERIFKTTSANLAWPAPDSLATEQEKVLGQSLFFLFRYDVTGLLPKLEAFVNWFNSFNLANKK